MATRRQLEAEARKHGATIDWSTADGNFINIDAPSGKVWSCGGSIHAICVAWAPLGATRPPAGWRAEAFDDAIERMQDGTKDCPGDLDCDCYPASLSPAPRD